MSAPTPPRLAHSTVELVNPAAPRSCMATTSSPSRSSRQASRSSFSRKGLPTWITPRWEASGLRRRQSCAVETVPAGVAPIRTMRLPGPLALAPMMPSRWATPTHMALTSGFPPKDGSKKTSPPTVGIPRQLPYPPIPPTTLSKRYRFLDSASEPNRNESRIAIGRAPIVKMSRTMPPTPVAAPW
jgi:hypothetical protein